MIESLREKLQNWHDHIDAIKSVDHDALELTASEKTMFGQIYLGVEGKNREEREAKVHTHVDWINFQKGLVEAKVALNHSKRRLELLQKAFDAEYLTVKIEGDAIKRG